MIRAHRLRVVAVHGTPTTKPQIHLQDRGRGDLQVGEEVAVGANSVAIRHEWTVVAQFRTTGIVAPALDPRSAQDHTHLVVGDGDGDGVQPRAKLGRARLRDGELEPSDRGVASDTRHVALGPDAQLPHVVAAKTLHRSIGEEDAIEVGTCSEARRHLLPRNDRG